MSVARGVELIAAERERQVSNEFWTPEHDDEHDRDEMARAAACYATPERYRRFVDRRVPGSTRSPSTTITVVHGWPEEWEWKPTPHDRIRELTKAGALIAAEIDRLHRLSAPPPSTGDKPCPNCPDCNGGCITATEGKVEYYAHLAPTPPPAPASKCHPCGVTFADATAPDAVRKAMERIRRAWPLLPCRCSGSCDGECYAAQRERRDHFIDDALRAASVAPAREGEAIQRYHMVVDGHVNGVPYVQSVPDADGGWCLWADVARVTPPQQEEDDWRAKCRIEPSGDCPGMFYVANGCGLRVRFLHPDGHWYAGLSGADSRFPTADAARAALAQAPRPTT